MTSKTGYKLSARSNRRLEGVEHKLASTVRRAIQITDVDFGVTCGLRTMDAQRRLVRMGKSQTMKSKHLTGHAVDVVAYVDGEVSWDHRHYDNIADAFAKAGRNMGAKIRWGGAWQMQLRPDSFGCLTDFITEFEGSMQQAADSYIELRRSQGRRPFIDMPHFELG